MYGSMYNIDGFICGSLFKCKCLFFRYSVVCVRLGSLKMSLHVWFIILLSRLP